MKGRRVVLFGAGKGGIEAWKIMKRNPALFDEQYVAYSDNNQTLWGHTLNGLMIISPDTLNETDADLFVICSRFEDSIRRQLVEDLEINNERVLRFIDYERLLYCEDKYDKKYGDNRERNYNRFDVSNIVVYTAIIGDYDELHEPEFTDERVTYVCLTDNHNIRSDVWNIEYVRNDESDNVRMARKIKINPHMYFPEYPTSVWVDGKFQVTADIREYIVQYGRESPMLCFPHFDRECIYDEGGKCIFLGVGEKREIIDQMSAYYKEGYPFDNGLFETGCIVRHHMDNELINVMSQWMEEVRRYSFRDQLSLPVVCKRNGFSPDISDVNCFCNRWLKLCEHKRWHGRLL